MQGKQYGLQGKNNIFTSFIPLQQQWICFSDGIRENCKDKDSRFVVSASLSPITNSSDAQNKSQE